MRPEWTLRTQRPQWIVDTFLVRTPDDSVGHHHGFHSVLVQELRNVVRNRRVRTDVSRFGEPALEMFWLSTVRNDDADRRFRGVCVVGTVECHRRDWIPSEPPARLL